MGEREIFFIPVRRTMAYIWGGHFWDADINKKRLRGEKRMRKTHRRPSSPPHREGLLPAAAVTPPGGIAEEG